MASSRTRVGKDKKVEAEAEAEVEVRGHRCKSQGATPRLMTSHGGGVGDDKYGNGLRVHRGRQENSSIIEGNSTWQCRRDHRRWFWMRID